MASYALQRHLGWRTQSRLGQKRRAKVGNNNGQLRIAMPPRGAHANPPGPKFICILLQLRLNLFEPSQNIGSLSRRLCYKENFKVNIVSWMSLSQDGTLSIFKRSSVGPVLYTVGRVKKTNSWLGFVARHFYGTVLCVESGFEIRFNISCIWNTQKWLFLFTKEFQIYTKENRPVQYFCFNLSTDGLIFTRSSLDCHIFRSFSVDTNIGYQMSH